MDANIRFTVDENRFVTDSINPTNSGKWRAAEDIFSDKDLRDCILTGRLLEMTSMFTINRRPDTDKPTINHSTMLHLILLQAMRTSHLNTFDPLISVQQKFHGRLKSEKRGLGDHTSIALFCEDVERLLRDLYGDIEHNALVGLKSTVFQLVYVFTHYACGDIWKEYECAVDADQGLWGVGLPDGYSINGSMLRRGMHGFADLGARVREVRSNRNFFGPYTVASADLLAERWLRLTEVDEGTADEQDDEDE